MQCSDNENVGALRSFQDRMRQTRGVMNQLHRESEKRTHMRKMLDAHMVYLANPYKLEEVEKRVLEELQEVVPIERVFMAGPYDNFDAMTVPTMENYEENEVPDNKSVTKARVQELKKQWTESRQWTVCLSRTEIV